MEASRLVVALVVALVGGGGIGRWLTIKSQNKRTEAQAGLIDAESESVLARAITESYQALVKTLNDRIDAVNAQHEQCQIELAALRKRVDNVEHVATSGALERIVSGMVDDAVKRREQHD